MQANRRRAEKMARCRQALYKSTSKLSLKERLQVLLKEDPDRVGVVLKAHEGTIDYERPGKKTNLRASACPL